MPLFNMENPFVYLTGYWVDKYINYFEAHWPFFFPSQSISIPAPQPDSRKSVNHVNHNTVGRLKWANAHFIQTTWLLKLRMKNNLMAEPGKIGTFQFICVVKLLFSLAKQDTNGWDCHCSLCFYFLPVIQGQNAGFCGKLCPFHPNGGAWCLLLLLWSLPASISQVQTFS